MRSGLVLTAVVCLAMTAAAQTPGELKAARVLAADVKQGPLAAHAFLAKMPKGSDLHVHLSGAVYAETFLKNGAEDGLCINTTAKAFAKKQGSECAKGDVPAESVFKNQALYDAMINSFSMRSFVPSSGWSGHDQFFATFGKFGGLDKKHAGEWVDEVASRAAGQNEQYLEIMHTPDFGPSASLGYKLGWSDDLEALREKLLTGAVRENVKSAIAEIDAVEATRKSVAHCGTPQAAPACTMTVRYIFQVLRAFPPQQVFAQTLLGFELASVDPRVVGINYVQPEDTYMSMSEYDRQMKFLQFLKTKYPKVHLSLHAGELAPGMVAPEGLKFHIREAVEVAGAERIGHGVDVMYETDADTLLKEMAEKHVMVEINLTSNDGILGITGKNHPLANYRAAKVPVSLSTDDEGVSRGNLTQEYTRAAMEQGLTYLELKNMARTGMEHNFLPGEDLWTQPDAWGKPRAVCAGQALGGDRPTAKCTEFLKGSEKAAQQWELERRFRVFEAGVQ
ncbi:adenosine deaminase family protein [Terriglobus tenax]|uniref:adenosine deaminase family protein n=1 Tax=Terriglobus tenax TaxID=1111115 RepID=UPI0021E07E4B|nr:adenosine deaminase [Terriglobus tenax]